MVASVEVKIDNSLVDDIIKWRRYLHQNPEISYLETKTSQFIYDILSSFGGLEITRPTPTGIVARLIGTKPGKIVAIRADIDALPIQELNDLAYASENEGVMHACGHDGHTAMLLGTAKLLIEYKDQIEGEIRFIFQHAEEMTPGGASELIKAGVMEGVDCIIGTHLWSPLESGKIGICYGPMMGSPDSFFLTINGSGGHAALPHQTIDSIAIGAQVVTNLQHIVSRKIDPLENVVLSITQFQGGSEWHVIPGTVDIAGNVRSLNPSIREKIPGMIEKVVKGITSAHDASYEFEYSYGFNPVINNDLITQEIESTAQEIFGSAQVERIKPVLAGEDFSAYQKIVPGCFFFIGIGNEKRGTHYPHHHPRFNIDEDALPKGVELFVKATLKLLQNNV
ncbi:M20 metallopeptidase family protein [Peribacillus sp. S4]|uniref:M20 metallopeptidase family protein n=1 Tax=Peribacillus sp. S4 TaxID=3384451 RepID=UPI00398A134E